MATTVTAAAACSGLRVLRAWVLFLLPAVGLLPGAARPAGAAPVDPRDLPFVRSVVPPAGASGEVASVVLDADVWAALDGRLANVRLFDGEGREQPVLIRPKAPTRPVAHERTFAAEVVSLREEPGNRIDIRLKRDPKEAVPCAIRLRSPLRDFEKAVTVWGSRDGQGWALLATNEAVFDYSRFLDVRRDRVELRPEDVTLYRVELANVTERKDSPLMELMRQHRGGAVDVEEERTAFWKQPFRMERIEFVERRETLVAGEVETLETAVAKWSTREDAARKASEVVFATARQPVVEVRVEAEDRNFARRVEVDGADRADATEWSRLAAATISGVHAGSVRAENLRVAFASPARQPFLRLTIVNEDNPPLRLTGVAVRERLYELLFFPKAGAAYRLCYGGAGVPTPHYDVGTVLATVPAGASATWALGPRSPTPDYSPRREFRGGRALLLGGVLVMVGVLAVLIARMARRVEE